MASALRRVLDEQYPGAAWLLFESMEPALV